MQCELATLVAAEVQANYKHLPLLLTLVLGTISTCDAGAAQSLASSLHPSSDPPFRHVCVASRINVLMQVTHAQPQRLVVLGQSGGGVAGFGSARSPAVQAGLEGIFPRKAGWRGWGCTRGLPIWPRAIIAYASLKLGRK